MATSTLADDATTPIDQRSRSPDDKPENHDPEKTESYDLLARCSYWQSKRIYTFKKSFRKQYWSTLSHLDYAHPIRIMIHTEDAVSVTSAGVVFLLQEFNNEEDCLNAFEQNQDKRIFFITLTAISLELHVMFHPCWDNDQRSCKPNTCFNASRCFSVPRTRL